MKIKSAIVTGCHGQVGFELAKLLENRCERLILTARSPDVSAHILGIDLMNEGDLVQLIRREQPEVIFNAAAYTAVDRAESEPSIADHLNRYIPSVLAQEAKNLGSLLVHFSTDYVFDGSGQDFRDETAKPSPLNVYGRTKLNGELAIQEVSGHHLIFRTSWVFSNHGQNFVKTMLRLGQERETIKIVNDQVGSPTSAAFLANAAVVAAEAALGSPGLSGLYHLCNANVSSWYGFAVQIFEEAKKRSYPLLVKNILPLSTAEYQTAAKRPLNSRLDCRKFEQAFGLERPHWQMALSETLGLLL